MKTTLSLDNDVAAQLEVWWAKQNLTFKQAVDFVLRRGLCELSRSKARTLSWTTFRKCWTR